MSRVLRFEVPPGKPVLRGHDHFWSVILKLDQVGPWGVPEVLGRTNGVDRSTVRDFIGRLAAGGIATVVSGAPGRLASYRLLTRPAATPRLRRDGTPGLQGRGQVAMWNVMRGPLGRDGFTAAELAVYATTESVPIARASAASYVKHLAQAGYLLILRHGRAGRPGCYRLRPGMAGPLPPMILRSQMVYDQNRGEIVGLVEAREVEP